MSSPIIVNNEWNAFIPGALQTNESNADRGARFQNIYNANHPLTQSTRFNLVIGSYTLIQAPTPMLNGPTIDYGATSNNPAIVQAKGCKSKRPKKVLKKAINKF